MQSIGIGVAGQVARQKGELIRAPNLPNELLGSAYRAVIERAGIDAGEVENVISGCVAQFGPQGLHVGRNAWLQAGLSAAAVAWSIKA